MEPHEEDETQYFNTFLKDENNKNLIFLMRSVIDDLRCGISGFLNVSFLRVMKSNATDDASFRHAKLNVEGLRNESGIMVLAPVSLFFLNGYVLLRDFLNEAAPKIPEDEKHRRALRNLLHFLNSDHSVFIENRGNKEMEWSLAVRLAQHLLIPLAQKKTFVIDSELQPNQCCSVHHPIDGKVGDTSFGCPKGWHGHVGIMITDKEVPFTVVEMPEDTDIASLYSDSTTELKNSNNFTLQAASQITAQAIVFSFLQRKLSTGNLDTCLVPGIGVCSEKMIICLYDCVEDILLQSVPIDLFSKVGVAVLSVRAVLVLWLVLNYEQFCSGVPDGFRKYKAEFHQKLGPDYLEIYRNEVEKPFHAKYSEEDSFTLDWVLEPCLIDVDKYVSKETEKQKT